MAKKTTPTTTKTKRPSGARKGVSFVPVTGDTSVKRASLKKLTKTNGAKRLPKPERVDAPAVLISVDLHAGPAKVSRYAGLFFMFVGVLFSAYALSGMYVELVELSTSDQHVYGPKLQLAQIVQSTIEPISITNTTVPDPRPAGAASLATSATGTTANTKASTTAPQAAPQPAVSTPSVDTTLMQPAIDVVVRGGAPHEGNEEIAVRVANAGTVELVLVPRETLTERYLGKAKRLSGESWQFIFDTKHAPNGDYALFARVTNGYGSYLSQPTAFRIKNAVPTLQPMATATPETAALQAEIANIAIEFKTSEPRIDLKDAVVPMIAKPLAPSASSGTATGTGSTTASIETEPLPPPLEERAVQFIASIESDSDALLELYGVAIRGNDPGAIAQMEGRLSEYEQKISQRVESELIGEGMVGTVDEAGTIRERIISLLREERMRRNREERMILDRVGDKIQRDSDRDGISDYDETHLYRTDPFVADTDADGFPDGAEVLSGYDPAREARETMVSFEDPRKEGTERSDILAVTRLDVLEEEAGSTTDGTGRSILFSGVALPNSFIALYVYSTPVVVTVKTNADGSWSYAFDKELEDGQHEAFVGVTDNAGKLVAKSKPYAFVKTADAYTIGRMQSESVPVAAPETRLMSEHAIVLTTSLVVVLVGLVLVLIGAYLARRPRALLVAASGAAGAV